MTPSLDSTYHQSNVVLEMSSDVEKDQISESCGRCEKSSQNQRVTVCAKRAIKNEKSSNRCCWLSSWSLLPILFSLISLLGFTITYLFAKSNCHIQNQVLPFVSYTGTEHPESMLFGMFLSLEGFVGFTVIFLAWRYYRCMGQRGCLNKVALAMGSISCFGVVMVGNFQVTKAKIPHYFGASLAFLCGNIYSFSASFLSRASFKVGCFPPKHGGRVVFLRLLLSSTMSVALVCLLGFIIYKVTGKKKMKLDLNSTICNESHASIHTPMQQLEFFASLSEWVLTVGLLLFLSLFAYEFKTFQQVKVVLQRCHKPLVATSRKKLISTPTDNYDRKADVNEQSQRDYDSKDSPG